VLFALAEDFTREISIGGIVVNQQHFSFGFQRRERRSSVDSSSAK
jgi:hypothetical protein